MVYRKMLGGVPDALVLLGCSRLFGVFMASDEDDASGRIAQSNFIVSKRNLKNK